MNAVLAWKHSIKWIKLFIRFLEKYTLSSYSKSKPWKYPEKDALESLSKSVPTHLLIAAFIYSTVLLGLIWSKSLRDISNSVSLYYLKCSFYS